MIPQLGYGSTGLVTFVLKSGGQAITSAPTSMTLSVRDEDGAIVPIAGSPVWASGAATVTVAAAELPATLAWQTLAFELVWEYAGQTRTDMEEIEVALWERDPLVSVRDVRTYLRLARDPETDRELAKLIDKAQAKLALRLGRSLRSEERTETFFAVRKKTLRLSNWPLDPAVEPVVTLDGESFEAFEVDYPNGILMYRETGYTGDALTMPDGLYEVTYTGGMEHSPRWVTLQEELGESVLMWVAEAYENRNPGATAESDGVASRSLGIGLGPAPPRVKASIDMLRGRI